MKYKNTSMMLIAITIVAISAYVIVGSTPNVLSKTSEQKLQIPHGMQAMADIANPDNCAQALSTVQSEVIKQGYKTPKYLPQGNSLQSGLTATGVLSLYFAPGSVCGENAKYRTFTDGIIQYYTATMDSGMASNIQEGTKYFDDYKAHSQRPSVISFFTINGKPAMGWESGMKKENIRWDNGTLVSSEDIPYPAQVQVMDPENKIFYKVKGFTALEELKKIAASVG